MRILPLTVREILPKGYKWVARQPWGMWVAFKTKPVVYRAEEDREGDFVPEYWETQKDGELEMFESEGDTDEEHARGKWKKSLCKVR